MVCGGESESRRLIKDKPLSEKRGLRLEEQGLINRTFSLQNKEQPTPAHHFIHDSTHIDAYGHPIDRKTGE